MEVIPDKAPPPTDPVLIRGLRAILNVVTLVLTMLLGAVVGFLLVPDLMVVTLYVYDHGTGERIPFVFFGVLGGAYCGALLWQVFIRPYP